LPKGARQDISGEAPLCPGLGGELEDQGPCVGRQATGERLRFHGVSHASAPWLGTKGFLCHAAPHGGFRPSAVLEPLGILRVRAIAIALMMAAIAPEVHRVLVACRAIELAMAAFYEVLADLHAHDPSMARLWRKTAHEEDNHAAQFSLLIEAMPQTVLATGVDLQTLHLLCSSIEALTKDFRLRPPSVREALLTAIELEVATDRLHAHQALAFDDPRHQRMFAAMMAADTGHVAQLRRALKNLL